MLKNKFNKICAGKPFNKKKNTPLRQIKGDPKKRGYIPYFWIGNLKNNFFPKLILNIVMVFLS